MSGLRVLVSGASIAGPATAYWLARAGARVTVIERFPEFRTGGQAVDLRLAGVSVMRRINGMEAAVRAKSTLEEGVSFVRADGRSYGVIRATGNPDQQSLISEYEILRGDLSRILHDLTRDNEDVRYVYGEEISSIQHGELDPSDSITVEYASGCPKETFDLVVACDGATSRTRAMGMNCGVRDHILPLGCWTAYYSTPKDILHGSRIGVGYNVAGGKSISLGTDPEGFTRVTLFGANDQATPDKLAQFRDAQSKGQDALKEFLARIYRGIGWKSDMLMDEMMVSTDLYASELVQVKSPTLHKGRFVMVGDAGYAAGPTGGGTSLALAGAYVLAGELSKNPKDISAALQRFEEEMRPIIKELQQVPPLVTSIMAPQTATAIWVRNNLFWLIAWTGIAEYVQKFFGAGFGSTKKYPLPEYEWVN